MEVSSLKVSLNALCTHPDLIRPLVGLRIPDEIDVEEPMPLRTWWEMAAFTPKAKLLSMSLASSEPEAHRVVFGLLIQFAHLKGSKFTFEDAHSDTPDYRATLKFIEQWFETPFDESVLDNCVKTWVQNVDEVVKRQVALEDYPSSHLYHAKHLVIEVARAAKSYHDAIETICRYIEGGGLPNFAADLDAMLEKGHGLSQA